LVSARATTGARERRGAARITKSKQHETPEEAEEGRERLEDEKSAAPLPGGRASDIVSATFAALPTAANGIRDAAADRGGAPRLRRSTRHRRTRETAGRGSPRTATYEALRQLRGTGE